MRCSCQNNSRARIKFKCRTKYSAITIPTEYNVAKPLQISLFSSNAHQMNLCYFQPTIQLIEPPPDKLLLRMISLVVFLLPSFCCCSFLRIFVRYFFSWFPLSLAIETVRSTSNYTQLEYKLFTMRENKRNLFMD